MEHKCSLAHSARRSSSRLHCLLVLTVVQTSYLLYAAVCRHSKGSSVLDYATMVLPILLGVTVFSSRPYFLNLVLGTLAVLLLATAQPGGPRLVSTVDGDIRKTQRRTKGQWLDESDSDEEPAEPAPQIASLSIPSSQPISATSSGISITASPTPSPSALMPESPLLDQKPRKRRHSPTPSTHSFTAIDILPTPENVSNGTMASQQASYPSPIAARLNRMSTKLPFLSVYRAHMMIMTIHCILAVDFSIFPRAQGKCEDFGASLVRRVPAVGF